MCEKGFIQFILFLKPTGQDSLAPGLDSAATEHLDCEAGQPVWSFWWCWFTKVKLVKKPASYAGDQLN